MKHLSESELTGVLDGALAGGALRRAERHLSECAACRDALAALTGQDAGLAQALAHDPGEAYFESFAARVQDRIRERGVVMDRDRVFAGGVSHDDGAPSLLERLGAWFSGPRLAWAGTAAALVVGAGLVFMVTRETPLETLRAPAGAPAREAAPQTPPASSSTPATPPLDEVAPGGAGARVSTPGAAPAQMPAKSAPAQAQAAPQGAARAEGAPAADKDNVMSGGAPNSGSAPASGAPPKETHGFAPTPASMREVRRVNGEDVPVGPERAPAAKHSAAPPPAPAANALQGPVLVKRPAAPLASDQSQPRADAQSLARDAGGAIAVCGTVRDASGRPVAGAQVTMSDAALTTTTAADGRWCLNAPPGEHPVDVMAVGFEPSRRTIAVGDGAVDGDFALAAVPVLEGPAAPRGRLGMTGGAPPATVTSTRWPSLVRPMATAAERLTALAGHGSNPAAYDRAAVSWEGLASRLAHDKSGAAARRAASDARWRAWQLAPSAVRRAAAQRALEREIAGAPSAAERGRAEDLLEQLRSQPAH